ncbi:outer membrane lipid asymmetry maintenance protein MlaD [Sandaracinobacteroides saxicola]|uniref:Outer membrane lipid asymmetry maintenance protein MlaD n=1 Tax=Sandaracinobacteroides saxicola TaxID=2759707 RepID=A0A7G5IK52_9SPHN|nr:outer membrane lipid asymmetry maintenance protein MlaD [Sandaracinobacteroides saxicola]QMW23744.1 outer membrane lipid asymmetry maintenance protein MlaD [Sandaracinobacteroides saxicola]
MTALLKEHVAEALTGLLVVLVAGWFAFYGWTHSGRGAAANGYAVTARFPNVTGVNVGSDVRVAGMKVGTVTAQVLDAKSFQAVLTLTLDPAVRLPVDSSAAITSEGLLGGSFIALAPGGESDMLRPGDEISDTQGATDLMGLVGSFINRSGETKPAEAAAEDAAK